MKKLTAILLVLAMALTLCACGGPNEKDYIGEYVCEAMEAEGMFLNPADLGMDIYMELEEKGEGIIFFEEEADLEWTIEDEETLILEVDGDEIEAEYAEGVIILELEDVGTMWFVGEDAELPEDVQEDLEEGGLGGLLEGLMGETEEPAVEEEPATEEAAPVEEEPAEEEAAAPAEFAPVSGSFDGCDVTIVGAEAIVDIDGKDAIRVYYDFTNTSDESTTAWGDLYFSAEQDGYEAINTYCASEDDAAEYGNDDLYLRPGVSIRCVEEYTMKPDGGPLTFSITDYWEEEFVTVDFDPANLPGAPTTPLEIEPIMTPTWTDSLSDAGTISEKYDIYIDTAELCESADGEPQIRIFFEFTNNSEEATSAWMALSAVAYQDGVQIESDFWADSETDVAYGEDVEPGETAYCSITYFLRNDVSPIEIEFSNWSADNVGCYFEFTE